MGFDSWKRQKHYDPNLQYTRRHRPIDVVTVRIISFIDVDMTSLWE